ncbi:MAG: hypothetical protein FJX54_03450 [Alphaproteobacteria bacterium]|nr:hypothetical protein [Alphaproteobacteria bacterium]
MIRRLLLCVLLVALAACQSVPPTSGDRCSGQRDDPSVAAAIRQSVERLHRLHDERLLSNDDICTMGGSFLARAVRRLDTAKPDRPGEWARWRALGLRDDAGEVRANGLGTALAQRDAVLAQKAAADGQAAPAAGLDATRWSSVGPVNIPGRVRAVAVHPSDGNKIWVGGVAGGIWKTTDGGSNWRVLTDFSANLAITSIVFDASNRDIMYASTGEGFFNADAIRGGGVYKSTDGGQTWIRLSSTDPGSDSNWYYVNRLATHPSTSGILLAANRSAGVYRSTDSGATWTRVLVPSGTYPYAYQVAFDPNDGNNAIVGLGSGRIAYSTDAGATWTTATVANTGSTFSGRVEVAYAPSASGTVYASVQNSSTGAVYRSTNGGASWSLRSSAGHLQNSQGWYDNTIWVSPVDSSFVVVGGIDLFRSTNGGTSFTRISAWFLWPNSPHADQHAIVAHPSFDGSSNLTVFVGNDGGVWKSTNIASATSSSSSSNTWSSISTGIVTTQFYGGASSASGGLLVGGTQDNGSLSASGTTTWTQFFGGDGGFSAIDQTDANYVYGEYVYASVHRSSDGGTNSDGYICSGIEDGDSSSCGGTGAANFIAPFILDPNSQSRMLVGAERLWISDNVKAATPSWRSAKAASSTSANYISAIAVASGNSSVIWVGHNNGEVYKTANGTATSPTWTAVTIGPSRQVMRILIDPSDSNTVYVSFGGYSSGNLRKTSDGGSSWTTISTGLPEAPIRGIARHPTNASWIYAGTEVGVFTSEDGGSSWSTTNDGPGAVSIDELFFAGTTTTLVAATHGRGMFQASLSSSSTTATPETGWWWYSSESGRGFSLEVSGNNIFFAGYLYSSNTKPIWYISQGARATNGVYQGSLLEFSGGQTLSGSYQAPSLVGSVGTLTLSFDTTTSGRLAWPGGTIPIARYDIVTGGVTTGPGAGMPQKGWWWASSESGRGYFMEVQGTTLFLASYMYDATGQAVWYVSLGEMTSTTAYTGTLTEFRGGQTLAGSYNAPVASVNVGTISLSFSSQTTAALTLPSGQQVALTRYTF